MRPHVLGLAPCDDQVVEHLPRPSGMASPAIGIFEIKNKAGRHVGIAIEGSPSVRIIWSDCLRRKVFCAMKDTIAFPQVFLMTVGLLCAVWLSSRYIRSAHFTCYTDSPILATMLRKGRDKRCRRTTTVMEAAFLGMINLDAFPTFELKSGVTSLEAPETEIPAPVLKWLGTLRPAASLASNTIKAMEKDGLISPL